MALVQATFVASVVLVAPIAVTPAAAASTAATLDQCANGKPGAARLACTGSQWQNGNINSSNSQYSEGDSVPFRAIITVPATTSHTIWIQFDITKSSTHAYDYLTSWNATETGDPTSGAGTLLSGTSTTPITTPLNAFCAAGAFHTPPAIVTGSFSMFGGTLTGMSYTTPGGAPNSGIPSTCTGDQSVMVQVTFTTSGTAGNLVLAWGGHIGTQQNWGVGNSAINITGSPYHQRIVQLDTTQIGNQDRSLKASAVLVAPTIVTQVSPGGNNPSVNVGQSVTDVATVSGSAGTPNGTVTFFLCTGLCTSSSAGGTQVGTAVSVDNSGQASSSAVNGATGSFPSGPLAAGMYCFRVTYTPGTNDRYTAGDHTNNTSECFTVIKLGSSTATAIHQGTGTGETTPVVITSANIGSTVHDSATVSGSGNGGTPTGTVTFTIYTSANCAVGTGTAGSPVTLVGGVADPSADATQSTTGISFKATYNGSDTYNTSTSECEPLRPITNVVGLIAPTQTTCQQYASGQAPLEPPLTYGTKNGKVNNVAPGVIFYFTTITVTSAGTLVSVTNTDTGFPPIAIAQNQAYVFTTGCVKVKDMSVSGATASATLNAGTYIIQIKYNPNSLVGFQFSGTPISHLYTFTTSLNGTTDTASTATIALNPK